MLVAKTSEVPTQQMGPMATEKKAMKRHIIATM
jgi:hypothetical protein